LVAETRRVLSEADREAVPVTVNTVVGRHNVGHLERILPLIAEHQCVRDWQLFQFMPIGPLGFRNRREFELSQVAFTRGVETVIAARDRLGATLRIDPKSCRSRKNLYLLVNDDGTAWTPRSSDGGDWSAQDVTQERNVLGNIRRREDVPRIVGALLSRRNTPAEQEAGHAI
jgi:MoaA/NifB/PqqE/SkfB family radical SAM enzyme